MKEEFRITLRRQFKSIKEGLIILSLGPIGIVVALVSEKFELSELPFLLGVFGLFYLVLFLPALYLHTSYFIDNNGMVLTKTLDKIEVKTKMNEFRFSKDDIVKSELNLGIYFKNAIDKRGRWTTPWSNYGYLRLKLKDGTEFYFTSLMADLDNPPIVPQTTRFRLVPYIDRRQIDYKEIRTRLDRIQAKKVTEYKDRFAELSDEKLFEKVTNPKRFEFEARKAAELILKERKKITTANTSYGPLRGDSEFRSLR